jgi:hypothetical protein
VKIRSYISHDDWVVIWITGLVCLAALIGGIALVWRGHWIGAIVLFLIALFFGFVTWFFLTWTLRMF